VVGPSTILSGVRKLPGGHLLAMDGNGMRIEEWYRPRFRQDVARRSRDPRELTEEFGHLLAQATRRCLVSDVPVALLFSGGLDSQGVLAAGTREGSELSAFTYRISEEWPAKAAEEAKKENGGARSEDLVVTQQQRLDRMREVYSSFTEPVGDGASLATWFLIHKARPHATVLLCGHGADEVLGGYRLSQDRFRLAGLRRLAWLPSRKIGEAIGRYCYGDESIPERRRRLRSFKLREAPAGARFIIHRPLPPGDLADLFHPGHVPAPYLRTIEELYARCEPSAGDLDRIQEVMIKTFLNENILTFADSVAMASSAELRMPYLDRDLVDFVFSLPRRWRVSRWPGHANTKMILREWGRDVLPESVLVEKKRTFNYGNIRFIIRDQRPQLQELVLGSSALRRALPGLEKWFGNPPEFFHGPREGTLWALLTLGVWCEGAGIR
jgi:asparagine synthase (glutamine-hydrolysing)